MQEHECENVKGVETDNATTADGSSINFVFAKSEEEEEDEVDDEKHEEQLTPILFI